MELNNLIVDDIPEIEYENIKNYVIKECGTSYKHYITYFHKSSYCGFYYYEFNNEIIGMITYNPKDENINMILNTETKFFILYFMFILKGYQNLFYHLLKYVYIK